MTRSKSRAAVQQDQNMDTTPANPPAAASSTVDNSPAAASEISTSQFMTVAVLTSSDPQEQVATNLDVAVENMVCVSRNCFRILLMSDLFPDRQLCARMGVGREDVLAIYQQRSALA